MDRAGRHTDWATHIRRLADEDPQAFLAEAQNVLDLSGHPAWGFLTALIEARVKRIEDQMLSDGGEPLLQAQYARKAGEIVGLRSLTDAVQTVLLKAEQVNEEQEQRVARLAAVGG